MKHATDNDLAIIRTAHTLAKSGWRKVVICVMPNGELGVLTFAEYYARNDLTAIEIFGAAT